MRIEKRIPLFEQAFAETPIVKLSGCYDGGLGNEIYIKRDDFIPFSFGGNKARKAAYFYREIQELQPDVVMTYGSEASNHCRIIANLAGALGIPCHIISAGEEEAGGRTLLNRQLVMQFGASVEKVPVEEVHDTIEARMKSFREEGKTPYFIQGGGHGNAGTQSYVDAFYEIRRQEERMGMQFARIFHASGTGSTQAGLVCGKELSGSTDQIIGISIARTCPRGKDVVRESILDYYRMLGGCAQAGTFSWMDKVVRCAAEHSERLFREEDLIFEDGYRLGGYGRSSGEEKACLERVMEQDGIPMDTTYVGKAFYGMLEYLKEHDVRGEKLLFIHTGGTPLYFDDTRRMRGSDADTGEHQYLDSKRRNAQ